jgi:hypothetical protein
MQIMLQFCSELYLLALSGRYSRMDALLCLQTEAYVELAEI